MARLPALIDTVADLDGRDRGSVASVARAVREAGLISTTNRGRGAADMTSADAAALLLGLFGADGASRSVEGAKRLQNLKREAVLDEDIPKLFAAIVGARTFGSALEALIEATPALHPLPEVEADATANSDGSLRTDPAAVVIASSSQDRVEAHLALRWSEEPSREVTLTYRAEQPLPPPTKSPVRRSTSFNSRSLLAVARTLGLSSEPASTPSSQPGSIQPEASASNAGRASRRPPRSR